MPFKPVNLAMIRHFYRLLVAIAGALPLSQAALANPSAMADNTSVTKQGQATLLIQSSPLAGSQFHALPEVVAQIRIGDALTLQREPGNPHDAHAVRVLWQGYMLGYVPRRENKGIARALDRGEPLVARVVALRPDESPWRRLRFEISTRLSD